MNNEIRKFIEVTVDARVADTLDSRYAESDHKAARYWRAKREAEARAEKAAAERDAAREALARVEALADAEIASSIEANVRSETAGVRCRDCNLRYEERQQYGCHESARAHYYDEGDIADAEASARADAIEYVTLKVAALRAALAQPATDEGAGA